MDFADEQDVDVAKLLGAMATAFNDTLLGGVGNDTLDGGLCNDKLTGGAGRIALLSMPSRTSPT